MNIGNRLKDIRTSKNISVYKLAQISEVSSTYIHEIEKGKKQPTVEIISKLCDSLEITLSDFFKDEVKESKISIDDVIKELKGLSPSQLKAIKMSAKAMKEYKK